MRKRRKIKLREPEIIAAIRDGLTTAPEIAPLVGLGAKHVSVLLCDLASEGVLVRAGLVTPRPRAMSGRPLVRWKLSPAYEAAQ